MVFILYVPPLLANLSGSKARRPNCLGASYFMPSRPPAFMPSLPNFAAA